MNAAKKRWPVSSMNHLNRGLCHLQGLYALLVYLHFHPLPELLTLDVEVDRQAHKRADVSKTPAPFSRPKEAHGATNEAEIKALEHRDRLLDFQAHNARRTTVRDEAADFDVSAVVAGTGGNMVSRCQYHRFSIPRRDPEAEVM